MLGWDVFRGTHPILKDLLVPFHTCAGKLQWFGTDARSLGKKVPKKPGDYFGLG